MMSLMMLVNYAFGRAVLVRCLELEAVGADMLKEIMTLACIVCC